MLPDCDSVTGISADPTLFHLWAKRFKFFVTGLIEVIYSWYKIVLGKTFPRYGRIQSWLAAIVLFYFFPQPPCLDWMDWHQVIINRYERSPSCSFLCNSVGNSELKKLYLPSKKNFTSETWYLCSLRDSMNTNNGNFNISRRLSEACNSCLMGIWYACLSFGALFSQTQYGTEM